MAHSAGPAEQKKKFLNETLRDFLQHVEPASYQTDRGSDGSLRTSSNEEAVSNNRSKETNNNELDNPGQQIKQALKSKKAETKKKPWQLQDRSLPTLKDAPHKKTRKNTKNYDKAERSQQVKQEASKPKTKEVLGSKVISERKVLLPAAKKSNPKRFARCGSCPPCLAESCGECHSCQMWAKHRAKAVGSVACERNICETPISLFGSKVVQDQHRQMDGICPLRMVNGAVYDFRCYICKVLPRVGSANRSELYRHYSLHHYSNELAQEFGTKLKSCPICQGELSGKKSGNYISHLGQVHNEVEKYLPQHAKIPLSVQAKGGGGRRIRRNQAIIKSRDISDDNDNDNWFPEVPEGYDPKGGVREIFPTDAISHFSQTVVIDGFTISNELDEDVEPLMVSRGDVDEIVMPSYEDSLGGKCLLCKKNRVHSTISKLVRHVHNRHGILGGSQYLMLDADRLLKGGYIALK